MDNHYYTSYIDSTFTQRKDQAFVKIKINGDSPTDEDVKEFIENKYPQELKEYKISSTYYDDEWLTDWNVGKPSVQKGCFSIILVYLQRK